MPGKWGGVALDGSLKEISGKRGGCATWGAVSTRRWTDHRDVCLKEQKLFMGLGALVGSRRRQPSQASAHHVGRH